MRAARRRVAMVLALVALPAALAVSGCGAEPEGGPEGGPFELVVHPEFVQGALPGEPVILLVAVEGGDGAPVELEVDVTGPAEAGVEPTSLAPGELAELTLTASAVTEETAVTLTVTARRGTVERSATKAVTIVPAEDDLGPTARRILDVFLPWLAEHRPELGLGPETELAGTIVAPRLLVVSHYAFLNDEYELGLAWHIMVPPDDWADVYVRARDELRPSAAFRLSSWSTALEGGAVEITPTEVPVEIVR